MNTVRLGDICQFINGGAWTQSEFSDSGYPVLKVSNCKPSGFVIDDVSYIPLDVAEKSETNKLHVHDVIIATVGSHPNLVDSAAGRSCIVTDEVNGYYLNQNAVCLRTLDDNILNQRYLGFLTQYFPFQHYIQSRGKGAANQMRIAISAIKEYTFDLPSIEIQDKIANILSAYDDLIENNQKQIKLLEEAVQRLYKEWFVDLRFPGHETTPIIDGIPEGWKKDTVDSIITLLSGFAFKSADFSDDGTYKIVTIKNVQDGMFDGHNVSRIVEVPDKMPKHCYLHDGDILLSLTGNVGRVCMVNGSDYLLNQRVAKIKSNFPAFAYCLFRSNDMFIEMGNLANGAAQQNLSPIKTAQIKILIPSADLFARFEEIASVYMKQTLNLNKQIELLQESRDRLLPKLMSGELEV